MRWNDDELSSALRSSQRELGSPFFSDSPIARRPRTPKSKLDSLFTFASLRDVRGGWTYIMTNHVRGVLYIGVAADLGARVTQHRAGAGSQFCRKYRLNRLVLAEWHDSIEDAIRREKLLKTWKRAWKIDLIEAANPTWRDLFDDLIA